MNAIKEHWFEILKSHFSNHAEIYLHDMDDFCLDVQWKLKNDPNRPNKRSRKIRLIISERTIDDYSEADDQAKQKFDTKLNNYIAQYCATFNPDHDTQRDQATPVVTVHLPFGMTY